MVVVQVDDKSQSVIVGTEQLKMSLESHVELIRASDYLKEVLFQERRYFDYTHIFKRECKEESVTHLHTQKSIRPKNASQHFGALKHFKQRSAILR